MYMDGRFCNRSGTFTSILDFISNAISDQQDSINICNMYDKYSQATPITQSSAKLAKHKGILIVPAGTSTPVVNAWAYNDQGTTFNLGLTFATAAVLGPQILPMSIYALTSISGCCAYRIN